MANTRKQIRRYIMRDLGDLRVLTATDAGTDVTFIDKVNLTGGIDAYVGRDVRFTGGTATNLGLERYVTGSSATQRAIGFGFALNDDVAVGDECEMINSRGTGYRFQDIHDAINYAIESIGPQALIPAASDISTFAYGTPISIPNEYETIEHVSYQDFYDTAKWHEITKAPHAGGSGWWVNKADHTVEISGNKGWVLDTYTIKLDGLTRPQSMYDDNDETGIDLKWLVIESQANLARGKHMRMATPENERVMYMLQQQAARFSSRPVTSRSYFSVRL